MREDLVAWATVLDTVTNYIVRLFWVVFAFWLSSEVVAYAYWLGR